MSTTNAKHTPGPWHASIDCKVSGSRPQWSRALNMELGEFVASVGGVDIETARANAELIAQAPTMAVRIVELEAQLARVTAERDHALDAMSGAADLLDAKDGTPHARVVRGVRESLLAALRACENGGAK